MALLRGWNYNLSVNNVFLDKDHQKLTQMINDLYDLLKKRQNATTISSALSNIAHCAREHFNREEKLLLEQKDQNIAVQKQEHELFLTEFDEIKTNFEKGNLPLTVNGLMLLNEWVLNHIMKVDRKYKIANYQYRTDERYIQEQQNEVKEEKSLNFF